MSCWCPWVVSLLVLLFLAFAWKNNGTAKAYIKFTVYAITSILYATLPIPLMLLNPRSSKNALFPAAALRFTTKHFLGLKCTVKGKENIVKETGSVVLINHQSVVDLLVLAELWPVLEKATVISKKEIFYIWPFGLAAWLWGTIYIDRLNGAKAKVAINKTGEIIRSRKAKVLMFPEGTRNMADKLLPFKKGAFHLAIASKCPIQPVVVSRYDFLGPNRFDEGEITINILPAIPTEDLSADDLPQLIEETYKTMQENFDRIMKEQKAQN